MRRLFAATRQAAFHRRASASAPAEPWSAWTHRNPACGPGFFMARGRCGHSGSACPPNAMRQSAAPPLVSGHRLSGPHHLGLSRHPSEKEELCARDHDFCCRPCCVQARPPQPLRASLAEFRRKVRSHALPRSETMLASRASRGRIHSAPRARPGRADRQGEQCGDAKVAISALKMDKQTSARWSSQPKLAPRCAVGSSECRPRLQNRAQSPHRSMTHWQARRRQDFPRIRGAAHGADVMSRMPERLTCLRSLPDMDVDGAFVDIRQSVNPQTHRSIAP